MYVVKRCVQDFNEVFKFEVAHFATEAEATEFAETEDRCSGALGGVWYEVEAVNF